MAKTHIYRLNFRVMHKQTIDGGQLLRLHAKFQISISQTDDFEILGYRLLKAKTEVSKFFYNQNFGVINKNQINRTYFLDPHAILPPSTIKIEKPFL